MVEARLGDEARRIAFSPDIEKLGVACAKRKHRIYVWCGNKNAQYLTAATIET